MSGFNYQQNYQAEQCRQGKYETRSRHSDSTDLFKIIRKFQAKKIINQDDLRKLIDLVNKHHISALKFLSGIFIKLRNQLVFADHQWNKLMPLNPDYKDKALVGVPIPFSKFFDQKLKIDRVIFPQIYSCLREKFQFYKKNSIAQNYVNEKDLYANLIKKRKYEIDFITIESAYPQAYHFYKTLEQFVDHYKMVIHPNLGDQQKQKIVYRMAKQQRNVLGFQNSSFTKPSQLLNLNYNLGDQQFYEIASFVERIKLQVSLASKNGPFSDNEQIQFKSIPIQCIGCATKFYQNQPITRDRSSVTKFEVIKSVKDSKGRLKELIEGFMNSPNGGVILFDCDDHLFEVHPKGFQTNMKTFESRKQSIIDSCKNYFKDLQIDKDFAIDFVILHDKNGQPIIHCNDYQTGEKKTSFFITRLKIFGRKITSELKIGDEAQNKSQKKQTPKIIANEVTNYEMQTIDYEEMKMRFYKNQNILKMIDKPQVYKKIQKAFYNDEHKMVELMKGRVSPLFLHQNYPCKHSEMVMISISAKDTKTYSEAKTLQNKKTDDSQKAFINLS